MIELSCGDLAATIAPEIGGSIAGFWSGTTPLLRPRLEAGPWVDHPLGMACFPMVPFVNRIAHGTFMHQGRPVTIPPNVPERDPLHGHGWQRAWDVVGHDEHSASLRIAGGGDAQWPWPYDASLDFALEHDVLAVTLGLRNRAREPFPVGLGLHPYLAGASLATLEARCRRVWLPDSAGIPVSAHPVSAADGFNVARRVAGSHLDRCFDGWSGAAEVRWAGAPFTLHVESTGCGFLHLYVPAGEDYFCVEPMNARPDAFNPRHDDESLAPVVEPDGYIEVTVRLRVQVDASSPRT